MHKRTSVGEISQHLMFLKSRFLVLRAWLQLRFDFASTAVRRPNSHDPLAAVTLTYLLIYLGHKAAPPRTQS